jgi:hypothetical protein
MRVSRAPERRGGVNKAVLFISLIGAAIVVGVLVTYFTTGFESWAANGEVSQAASNGNPSPEQQGAADSEGDEPTATPMPTVAVTMLEAESAQSPLFIPDVHFGEVLAQGFVDVKLPGNHTAQSWYTYQVNTVSRDITLFFAIYDSSLGNIVRTVKIEQYSQGSNVERAEVTLFYPEAGDRVIVFDRDQGKMTVTQHIQQPYGPSLFSPELRVNLVTQRVLLADQTGDINAELQLDLTGLSDSEVIVFQRTAPNVVSEVLSEIKDLVNQIEAKRPR